MARKTRRRRDRRRIKEEKRRRMVKATAKKAKFVAETGGYKSVPWKLKGRVEVEIVEPKKAMIYTTIFSFLMIFPLLSGGIYLLNFGKYTHDIGINRQDWYVIGLLISLVVSITFGFYAKRRMTLSHVNT